MEYIHFIGKKNMKKKTIKVEELEKIEEENLDDDEPMIEILFDSKTEMFSYY